MSISFGESKNMFPWIGDIVMRGPKTGGVVETIIPIWGLASGKEVSIAGGITTIWGLMICVNIALLMVISTL